MAWSFDSGRAVYIQVAERLRRGVITGVYGPGEQIPSVRQLAFDAAVNPNTVQHAFSELESEGLIESRGTLGRFVTEDPEKIAVARKLEAKKLVGDFVSGALDLSLSEEETLQLIKEAFDERS
ncbi:MAG: GntR family transcriptional regulator [Clostridia bacterium]|nr:GntR family transcriptional regulator [Clostridia bacterium]